MVSKILRILTAGNIGHQVLILSKLMPYYLFNKVNTRGPIVLRIEITNKCNMNCIMCEREALSRQSMNMEFDVFKKIIDDAVLHNIKVVGLNRFGEPTMHPKLVEMAKYAKDKGIRHISFCTNASLLSEKLSRQLIKEQCVDEIVCSIDGNTPETYAKIRGNGVAFEKVVANVENLVRIRNEMKLGIPKIYINTIHMSLTNNEIHDVINRWKNKVDGICVLPYHEYGDVRDTGLKVESICKNNKKSACPFLAYMLVAYADGVAGVCCGDSNGVIKVGNFNNQTIHGIWNGSEIKKIRDIHFKKDFDCLPVCKGCEFTNHVTYWGKHYVFESYKKLFYK